MEKNGIKGIIINIIISTFNAAMIVFSCILVEWDCNNYSTKIRRIRKLYCVAVSPN